MTSFGFFIDISMFPHNAHHFSEDRFILLHYACLFISPHHAYLGVRPPPVRAIQSVQEMYVMATCHVRGRKPGSNAPTMKTPTKKRTWKGLLLFTFFFSFLIHLTSLTLKEKRFLSENARPDSLIRSGSESSQDRPHIAPKVWRWIVLSAACI